MADEKTSAEAYLDRLAREAATNVYNLQDLDCVQEAIHDALAQLLPVLEACSVERTSNETDTFRYANRVRDAYRALVEEGTSGD